MQPKGEMVSRMKTIAITPWHCNKSSRALILPYRSSTPKSMLKKAVILSLSRDQFGLPLIFIEAELILR